VIQDRDLRLLREIATARIVDREQAKCMAGFGSTRRANSRLLTLARGGLLRRFFLGTRSGGQKALYALSRTGAKLIQAPYRGLRRGQNEVLVADFSVIHQLAVNDVYCAVKFRSIPAPQANVEKWLSFSEPLESGTRLIPDGYFEIAASETLFAAFLEVDLGHESLLVWRKKVESYLRYAVSGKFSTRFRQPQFRVLVIANTERRMQSLRSATRTLTEKVFWFCSFETAIRGCFWLPVWLRPNGEERRALL
jgi:hypothetical protein